ncbi:SAM-dependent methyltransferase [Methylobacterium sp. PvP109]|uniref:SAM-dependent methyltransferase n=1 Tax=Methylobacterium radiotolerans TaxID=31998 RepID=A0ABV2NLX4_9HYPH|nr:SAM-dependent methyltransferase [Methylobacterium sp. PvP105]MBP2504368.1 SAM-dependent methyltransferase [Methylobacterium sp. PvP109]
MNDALTAPAVARNRDAILAVLREVLPASGTVLEIASGSGEHAVHVAAALPGVDWLPSDPEPAARRSIAAHALRAGLGNIRPPLALDAAAAAWPVARVDGIVCINMIHIAPWAATAGLMAGAGRVLSERGILFLYGPFREADRPFAESNAAFDASLRGRDPAWGVRDLDAVAAEAARHGLDLIRRVAMPANNLSVIFERSNR